MTKESCRFLKKEQEKNKLDRSKRRFFSSVRIKKSQSDTTKLLIPLAIEKLFK